MPKPVPVPGSIDERILRDALAHPVPLPELGARIDLRNAKPAAVVVPIALAPIAAAFVVLRSAHLADHAGEVGFPGGKPEPQDADLAATAIRELGEEVGVAPTCIDLVGELAPIPVITGRYLIHPFVGILRGGATPRVASPEIARVLTVPLLPLLDGDPRIEAVRAEWGGREVFAPHFPLEGFGPPKPESGAGFLGGAAPDREGCILYGASAYILYELLARLAARLRRTLPEPRVQTELPWGRRYDA